MAGTPAADMFVTLPLSWTFAAAGLADWPCLTPGTNFEGMAGAALGVRRGLKTAVALRC
jgi:hypothetical protein